jgi:hypothetical protein
MFKVGYSETLSLLRSELAKLGASKVYLQADVTEHDIRNDGQLRADSKPRSPRVIVSAKTKHGDVSLPCDTFTSWQANLRAIALSLEALRTVDRYGVTKRGEQYRGLKQLTAGTGPINSAEASAFVALHGGRQAAETAGSSLTITAADLLMNTSAFEAAYKRAAKRLHVDAGGSEELWLNLQKAAAILREHHGIKGQL